MDLEKTFCQGRQQRFGQGVCIDQFAVLCYGFPEEAQLLKGIGTA